MSVVKEDFLLEVVRRYEADPGMLIPMMQDLQAEYGYLPPEELKALAKELGVPLSRVYGVAMFYASFRLSPKGQHEVTLCMGTVCYLKGAPKISEAICEEYGVKPGGTTSDRLFTLQAVNCVGACALAPVMVVDGKYYDGVTPDSALKVLRGLAESGAEAAAPAVAPAAAEAEKFPPRPASEAPAAPTVAETAAAPEPTPAAAAAAQPAPSGSPAAGGQSAPEPAAKPASGLKRAPKAKSPARTKSVVKAKSPAKAKSPTKPKPAAKPNAPGKAAAAATPTPTPTPTLKLKPKPKPMPKPKAKPQGRKGSRA
jgi:NADH-quinone oxidoreductase subunit E